MPKKVHDLERKLEAKGYPASKAWPIAQAAVGKRKSKKARKK